MLAAVVAITGGLRNGTAQGGAWSVLVPESEIVAAAGGTASGLGAMATNGAGLLAAVNNNGTTRQILRVDLSKPAGSRVTVAVTAADLAAALAAGNGTATDPAATAIRVSALGFTAPGSLVALLDSPTGMHGALVVIQPNAPHTIRYLCGDHDATISPVEGSDGMAVVGSKVYVVLNDSLGSAQGDVVMAVDTASPQADGTAPATVAVNQTPLMGATGDIPSNMGLNGAADNGAGHLLATNSGTTLATDNVVRLDPAAGTAATHVAATDIESDIGATDVGFTSIAVDSSGRVWLANMSGTGTGDNGIVILDAISPPTATATLHSEGKIRTEAGGSNVFLAPGALAFDAASGRILASSDGTGNSGILAYPAVTVSRVAGWEVY